MHACISVHTYVRYASPTRPTDLIIDQYYCTIYAAAFAVADAEFLASEWEEREERETGGVESTCCMLRAKCRVLRAMSYFVMIDIMEG